MEKWRAGESEKCGQQKQKHLGFDGWAGFESMYKKRAIETGI